MKPHFHSHLALFLCLPAFLMAETPPTPPVQAPVRPQQTFPNTLETLQKDFFDKKADEKPSDNRYNAGDPDYTSDQREAWLKACEKYKNKDLEAYRKCFQDEKAKTKEALRQKFEEVERRQALPLKNTNPLLEELERNGSGQVDE